MQRAILKWDGVPTQIITEGRWVEEGLSENGKRDVVVVIVGNPGIAEFYDGFIKNLKTKLPSEVPIWVVGHAGHVQPASNLAITMPSDSMWCEHYSLMAQVEHKKTFIKMYVPENARLHLIGHSIGSWMILNILKDKSIAERVTKCYLLFPTIEHMAVTKNGWFFTKIISRFAQALIFLSWMLSCLPIFLQIFIVGILSLISGVPAKCKGAMLHLFNPYSLKRIIKMAKEEMNVVKERDDFTISQYEDKLWFYYGNCDSWVPVKYYEDLKSKHPNIKAELCKYGYQHSFVLRFDKEMAEIVADAINGNIL